MKIIDIASGRWLSSTMIKNGTLENLSLFSDQYSNWSELIEDIWKDAYFEAKDGFQFWISKAMVRVINPSYQILFPIILSHASSPSTKPTSVDAKGTLNIITGSGLGISAFQVNLSITSGTGTIQFFAKES